METRRDFLRKTSLLGLAGLAGSLIGGNSAANIEEHIGMLAGDGKVTLPPLPYAHDALEPFIDRKTMDIHHSKHHQGYIDKLNTASGEIDLSADMAENCRKVDEKTSALVRNNLGGHYNHLLFWQMLRPAVKDTKNEPQGNLAESIRRDFKSFENFKKEFSEKAGKHFGSGWCWLIADKGKLSIVTTPNQDNPLMKVASENGTPVLALDVWEHAYYLKYQNKRAEYIENWWNVVNWTKSSELFNAAK
jgi:superoxide dismutase, Fe-Mn family